MSSPVVSVIIPVYNRAEQLQAAVGSVLNQTFTDYELIIVDDGSDAPIPQPLPQLSGEGEFLVLRKKHGGVSSARNMGIEKAGGKYITFLDSDDVWLPEKLEKQVAFMQTRPEYLLSQTQDIWMRDGQRVNPQKKHQKKGGDIFFESLYLCLISPSAVIIRRELFDKVGCFDESLPVCEDYDLWLRVAKDHQVGLLDEPLIIRYAGHPDQLSGRYWGMDRFRLKSLKNLLRTGGLSLSQNSAVKEVIEQKRKILARGALKRFRFWTWFYYRFLLKAGEVL